MRLVLMVWLLVAELEVLAQVRLLWPLRRHLVFVHVALELAASALLLGWRLNLFSVLLVLLSGYRLCNQLRLLRGRMHERYLHRATLRTTLVLIGSQGFVAICWVAWTYLQPAGHVTWLMITGIQLAGAVVLLVSTSRRLRHTTWPSNATHLADSELPTLSVAIPARNETDDLEQCLRSVIASDYPKLEILVLDDCSQTRRTPEIIRGFAHDGVRFIRGEPPQETWLPKTQAYAQLAQEASGEYVLFCGVDIRFAPDSLRQIVRTMLAKHKLMLSILPVRTVQDNALVQAMRYFWELVPPRRLFKRPAVLSSCWIMQAAALKRAGGFEAVARAIVPEAHFARQLLSTDGYAFLRASQLLGVTSVKTKRDQRETAIRMRYPQLHRRPENVVVGAAAAAGFLLLPFVLAIAGWWLAIGWPAQALAFCTCLLLTITYERMGMQTRVTKPGFGLIALPIMVAYDIVITHVSMWLYEFSVVEWKGRNICIPAMHVIPHLPKL